METCYLHIFGILTEAGQQQQCQILQNKTLACVLLLMNSIMESAESLANFATSYVGLASLSRVGLKSRGVTLVVFFVHGGDQ